MGKQKVFPGEYDCFAVSPIDNKLYSAVTQQTSPGVPVAGAPVGIIAGSGCLHHYAFLGSDGTVYVSGDNPSNISGTGTTSASIPFTKTPVSNVKQVVAYDSYGTTGYGVACVTNDGKLILMGATISGFRGDGTEGNAAEPSPYTVPLTKPISKVVAGEYIFVLYTDGTVGRWGGTKAPSGWAPYSCGAFVASPDLTHIGTVALPEPIVDIIGGGDWSYAIGKSGKIYGWGYGPLWFGVTSITQNKMGYWDLTAGLNLPGTLLKLMVGPEATYALMTSGDLYAWGNNTQAAIGNGQEAAYVQQTKVADWGYTSRALMQLTPVKVNPKGISFVNTFTAIGDAFYIYAEDSNGNLWNWGRNKGWVLWNGQGGSPDQQSSFPNTWDVLSPEQIKAFGPVGTNPPPPPPANISPIASLPAPMVFTWPANGIQIDGSASKDPDGTIVAYKWTIPSGVSISDPTAVKPFLLFPGPGSYSIGLMVTDNQGATGSANIQVTINPAPVVAIPPPRTVTALTVDLFGETVDVPISAATFSFSDGGSQ